MLIREISWQAIIGKKKATEIIIGEREQHDKHQMVWR